MSTKQLKFYLFLCRILFCCCLILGDDVKCPVNSKWIGQYNFDHSLQINKEAAPWIYAEDYCQGFGGHLVSIHNGFVNGFLNEERTNNADLNGKDIFLGSRKTVRGWAWSDLSQWNYNKWAPGSESLGECGLLRGKDQLWSSTDCSTSFPFFCALPPITTSNCTNPTQTSSCPSGSRHFADHNSCVLGKQTAVSFDLAEKYCQAYNGHLVAVKNLFDQTFVDGFASELSSDTFYIGARKVGSEYQWTDGSRVTYTRWAPGEPKWDCVVMSNFDGKWLTTSCDTPQQFVCNVPKVETFECPTTQAPTTKLPTTSTTTTTTTTAIIPTTTTSSSPPNCSADQTIYNCNWNHQRWNGFEYWVGRDKTFEQAEYDCNLGGGNLVSIHSDAEFDFTKGLCCEGDCNQRSIFHWRATYVTGGKFDNGAWMWTDKSPFDDYHKGDCSLNTNSNNTYFLWMNRAHCGNDCDWGATIINPDAVTPVAPPYYICKKKVVEGKET